MKKVILAGLAAATLINAAPAYAWNDSHCNTAVGETRSQKGQLIKECIGKFSRVKYAQLVVDYGSMNRYGVPGTKTLDRVQDVIDKGMDAINDPSIKWKKHSDQKHIDNAKLAATVIGGVVAGTVALSTGAVMALSSPVFHQFTFTALTGGTMWWFP